VKEAPSSTVSEFKSNLAQVLDGGAIYVEMATLTGLPLDLKITSTTFQSNIASSVSQVGGNGGAISIMGATDIVDVTLTSCTIATNKALGGNGGFIYIPPTSSTSNVFVTTTSITSTEAKNDGGAFYIAGTGHKILQLVENPIISNSKATTGSGGIAYI
jgi:hypothetical protein